VLEMNGHTPPPSCRRDLTSCARVSIPCAALGVQEAASFKGMVATAAPTWAIALLQLFVVGSTAAGLNLNWACSMAMATAASFSLWGDPPPLPPGEAPVAAEAVWLAAMGAKQALASAMAVPGAVCVFLLHVCKVLVVGAWKAAGRERSRGTAYAAATGQMVGAGGNAGAAATRKILLTLFGVEAALLITLSSLQVYAASSWRTLLTLLAAGMAVQATGLVVVAQRVPLSVSAFDADGLLAADGTYPPGPALTWAAIRRTQFGSAVTATVVLVTVYTCGAAVAWAAAVSIRRLLPTATSMDVAVATCATVGVVVGVAVVVGLRLIHPVSVWLGRVDGVSIVSGVRDAEEEALPLIGSVRGKVVPSAASV